MSGKELLCKLNIENNKLNCIYEVDGNNEFYCDESQNGVMKLILSDIPKEVDITKKQAAIIVHEYIKKVMLEKDETDTSSAGNLKDLYDCRICVQHIEQLYCKGIMRPLIDSCASKVNNLPMIFGANEMLSESEAKEIVLRVFQPELRIRY